MKKHVKFSVCLLISAIFAGCATSSDNLNSYVDPSLDISLMHKIALFPMENSEFAHSEIRIIDRKVTAAIHSRIRISFDGSRLHRRSQSRTVARAGG